MKNDLRLFYGSCFALISTAFSFAIYAGILPQLGDAFGLTATQLGFITSMWLKYVISQEKPMHYIVFGVKNMAHRHKVLDEINRKHTGEMRNSGRPPTMSDLPKTADFCEYFVGSNKITTKINRETNKNIHTIYTFPGVKDRYNRELKMNYEGYEGKLCATLPEFVIKC